MVICADVGRQNLELKRAFDLLLTIPALFFLFPFGLVLAGFVWMKLGRPVLFRQPRLGLRSRPFTLLKFPRPRLWR